MIALQDSKDESDVSCAKVGRGRGGEREDALASLRSSPIRWGVPTAMRMQVVER